MQLPLLLDALAGHSEGRLRADLTVQVCWDADRLDLGRVGVMPAAERLCTAAARDPLYIRRAYAWAIGLRRGTATGDGHGDP